MIFVRSLSQLQSHQISTTFLENMGFALGLILIKFGNDGASGRDLRSDTINFSSFPGSSFDFKNLSEYGTGGKQYCDSIGHPKYAAKSKRGEILLRDAKDLNTRFVYHSSFSSGRRLVKGL